MKNWKKSKTIIFNILVAVATAVEMNFEFIKESNPEYYIYIVIFVTAVNVYLRTITTETLTRKKKNVDDNI